VYSVVEGRMLLQVLDSGLLAARKESLQSLDSQRCQGKIVVVWLLSGLSSAAAV
jgi:hypothetical protein